MRAYLSILMLAILFVFSSCGGGEEKKEVKNEIVKVHILSEPTTLNPQNHGTAIATHMCKHLFQTLVSVDFKTGKLVPILADSLARVTVADDEPIMHSYTIRKEATWDDGTPITAADVVFSFKVLMNKFVDNAHRRPYFDIVDDVFVNQDNSNEVVITYSELYIQSEWSIYDVLIIDHRLFDPKGLLKDIPFQDLVDEEWQDKHKDALMEFASVFNSVDFQRNPKFVRGSGAYELLDWKAGNSIRLKRKASWWGYQMNEENMFFKTFPQLIHYVRINDWAQALSALKLGKIDVMVNIPTADFLDLKGSESFTKEFDTFNPEAYGFEYLAFNMRKKNLPVEVRKAIGHIIDVDYLINKLLNGMGDKIVGPVHPSKDEVHPELQPYAYSLETAKNLLNNSGWKDTDGNGILDKEVNGKKEELKLNLIYNAGNDRRRSFALLLKEDARKLGIEIELSPMDWSIYKQERKQRNFDMIIGAWGGSSAPSDPKQVWHTESMEEGSNFAGFGDESSDNLIEEIRTSSSKEEMISAYHKLQERIHADVPYVFLFAFKERMAIHKRLNQKEAYKVRPGYWEGQMK